MKALVTGISGQCGSYLAEYLLDKGYEVHGLDRRKSVLNHENIDHIKDSIQIIEGDITDAPCMYSIIDKGKYDEIYNLAAMSHVGTSFNEPNSTFQIDTLGVVNILEAMRKYSNHTRMYQASTSELFGKSLPPQNESTELMPQSPYGCAKLAAHHMVRIYHQSYKLHCACGIMFNSESKRRGINFVTRKITEWIKSYAAHLRYPEYNSFTMLQLGNLDAKRDWIHAKDSVDAIYRICNQDKFFLLGEHGNHWTPYVFGCGKAYSVRNFLCKSLEAAFDCQFSDRFSFAGEGLSEVLIDKNQAKPIMKINPVYFRPSEVEYLESNPSLIKEELGWSPKFDLDYIINDMLFGDKE